MSEGFIIWYGKLLIIVLTKRWPVIAIKIDVIIHEDNSITVIDNGRGIPVGENAKLKKSTLEVVMTVLHAGVNLAAKAIKYLVVCMVLVSPLLMPCPSKLIVKVKRDGHIYQQEYRRGAPQYDMKIIGDTDGNGNNRFTSSRTLKFLRKQLNMNMKFFNRRIRELAFLNKGLKLHLTDERTGMIEYVHVRRRNYRVRRILESEP